MENAENSPQPFYLLNFPTANHVENSRQIMLTPKSLSTAPEKSRSAAAVPPLSNLSLDFHKKGRKSADFCLINSPRRNLPTGNFRVMAGISEVFVSCKPDFAAGFPQTFPQTVEKSGDKMPSQTPPSGQISISFRRSFISTAKAGFDSISRSITPIDETIVEWSRPNIFPMAGSESSVFFRSTYTAI